MKLSNTKFFQSLSRAIPAIVILALGLGTVGCEYYYKGDPSQVAAAPDQSEDIKTLEKQITDLQGQLTPSSSSEELAALQQQIAVLQKAIDDLKNQVSDPGTPPVDSGDQPGPRFPNGNWKIPTFLPPQGQIGNQDFPWAHFVPHQDSEDPAPAVDVTAPTIRTVVPSAGPVLVGNTAIIVEFSETIKPGTIDKNSLRFTSVETFGSRPLGQHIVQSMRQLTPTTYRFEFTPAMEAGNVYTLTLKKDGIKDVAGNLMAVDYRWTIGEPPAPAAPPPAPSTPNGPSPPPSDESEERSCQSGLGRVWNSRTHSCNCSVGYIEEGDRLIPVDSSPNPPPTCVPQVGAVVIDILVGDESRAGTDSTLTLKICPNHESDLQSCVTRHFSTVLLGGSDPFERGTANRVLILFNSTERIPVGNLVRNQAVYLTNNGGGDGPSFLLDSINVYATPYSSLPHDGQRNNYSNRVTAELLPGGLGTRLPVFVPAWDDVLSESFPECLQWIDEEETVSFGPNAVHRCD